MPMIESATKWNDLQSLLQDGRAGKLDDPKVFADFTANDLAELDAWAGVPENTTLKRTRRSETAGIYPAITSGDRRIVADWIPARSPALG